jgi:hypothetical protein
MTSSSLPGPAGASFGLDRPANEARTIGVDGWQVEVHRGQDDVVARGGRETDCESVLGVALPRAQQALDIMSLQGGNDLLIRAWDDEHIAWWPEASGLVLRRVSFAPLRINVPPAELRIHDAQGQVIPSPPEVPMAWHESLRYFRLSQTTSDLFDAYRNAYLALESVLSAIAPQRVGATGKIRESEGDWFTRALRAADKLTSLASFVPPGSPDPVQALRDDLYHIRGAISHAKSGRHVLTPQHEADRALVTTALLRVINIYLKLAEVHLHVRRLTGGITEYGARMASQIWNSFSAYASDDESPFDESNLSPNPRGGLLLELTPAGLADTSVPFQVSRLWTGFWRGDAASALRAASCCS